MAKTLVVAIHEEGPAINGHDHCFARAGNSGLCPGVTTARWLNNLGGDDEYYIHPSAKNPNGAVTNGQVRANYARDQPQTHVRYRNMELGYARAEVARLSAGLRVARTHLRRLEKKEAK